VSRTAGGGGGREESPKSKGGANHVVEDTVRG